MNGTGRRPRINPLVAGFLAGALIAGVIGLMATINLQYGAPWASTHTVTAQVTDADSMAVGSDVRIGGRLVGQVVGITAAGDHTDVKFHVDDADWPLPADTTASVRLATLLGQKYIQLNPGSSSNKLGDNAVLSVQRTKPVVDFDQILNTFDKPTRDALTQLIRTLAGAVQGREGTFQQLLPDFGDLSVHSQTPTQELVTRDPEINAILINLGITADQLNRSRDDLAGLIDSFNSVNATLASNEGTALKGYITNGDTLNRTTDAVLHGAAAGQLADGLRQVGTFTNYLNSLLTSLIPQTSTFNQPNPLAQPSDKTASNPNAVPAVASIDLIYEIGSATSQGNGFTTYNGNDPQANFWLRQNAAGIDPCGLITSLPAASAIGCVLNTGSSGGTHTPATAPPPQQQQQGPHLPGCIPLVTCNLPPICVPLPNVPCVTLPPTPCISLPPTPTPSLGLPLPTLAPCTSPSPSPTTPGGPVLPTLPIPLPTPTLPLGLGLTASDDIHLGDGASWATTFAERYR